MGRMSVPVTTHVDESFERTWLTPSDGTDSTIDRSVQLSELVPPTAHANVLLLDGGRA